MNWSLKNVTSLDSVILITVFGFTMMTDAAQQSTLSILWNIAPNSNKNIQDS